MLFGNAPPVAAERFWLCEHQNVPSADGHTEISIAFAPHANAWSYASIVISGNVLEKPRCAT
jgi:hypothetical protein